MPMTTQRTTIPSWSGYQLDAAAVLTAQLETQMSPTGWKTNLQHPKKDAKKFIRKLSTGRDTGFRESGSRSYFEPDFFFGPVKSQSISSPTSQSGPVKVDQTLNQSFLEPGGTYGQL
jgi:hypothetical protein